MSLVPLPRLPISREKRKGPARFLAMGGTMEGLYEVINDPRRRLKYLSEPTEKAHAQILKNFTEFITFSHSSDPTFLPTCLPYAATPEQVVVNGAPFPSQGVITAWLTYLVTVGVGNIGAKLSIQTVRERFHKFVSAVKRKTGSNIDKTVKEQVLNFISNDLKLKFGLKRGIRPKAILTPDVMLDIMEATFAVDFPTQLLRIRLQILTYICLALSSSNRAGSIVRPEGYTENLDEDPHCLTWGAILFRIDKNPTGGRNLLFCKVDTRYGKTVQSVDKSFILLPHDIPAANGQFLLLILAMMDGAIKGFDTIEQVLDPALFNNRTVTELHLSINTSSSLQPILRQRVFIDGSFVISDTKSLTTGGIAEFLGKASHVAGFAISVSTHDLRRFVATVMIGSTNARMEVIQNSLGHKIGGNMIKHYMNHINQIDTVSFIFAGEKRGDLIIESFNTTLLKTDWDSPVCLSVSSRVKIFEDEELKAVMDEESAMKQRLLETYGSFDQTPPEEYAAWKQVYQQSRQIYIRLYRYHMARERAEHYTAKNVVDPSVVTVPTSSTAFNSALGPDADDDEQDLQNRFDLPPKDGDLISNSFNAFKDLVKDVDFNDPKSLMLFVPEDPDAAMDTCDAETANAIQKIVDGAQEIPDSDDDEGPDETAPAGAASASPSLNRGRPVGNTGSSGSSKASTISRSRKSTGITSMSGSSIKRSALGLTTSGELMPPPPTIRRTSVAAGLVSAASTSRSVSPVKQSSVNTSRSRSTSIAESPIATSVGTPGSISSSADTPSPSFAPAQLSRHKSILSRPRSASASSVEGDAGSAILAAASVMDEVRTQMFKMIPDIENQYDVLLKVAHLPLRTNDAVGYWPGLGPVMRGQLICCSTCETPLKELVPSKSSKSTTETSTHIKYVAHTYKCARDKAKTEMLPVLLEKFSVDTESLNTKTFVCHLCPVSKNWKPRKVKGAAHNAWRHIYEQHYSKCEEGMKCGCGVWLPKNRKIWQMHFARCHTQWLSFDERVDFFNFEPQFDLELNRMCADPCEWETACEGRLLSMQATAQEQVALGEPYASRDDIVFNPPRPTQGQDIKYKPIHEMSDRAMLQFGTCLFCFANECSPASSRMKQHIVRTFVSGHVIWHIRQLIALGKQIGDGEATDVGDRSDADEAANHGTQEDDASFFSTTQNSILAVLPAVEMDFGTHTCPDIVCKAFHICEDVDLLTFVNHITIIHQISFRPLPQTRGMRTEANCVFPDMQSLVDFFREKKSIGKTSTGKGKGKGKGKEKEKGKEKGKGKAADGPATQLQKMAAMKGKGKRIAENSESETSDTNYSDDEFLLAHKSPPRPSPRKRNRVMGKGPAAMDDDHVIVVSDTEENRFSPPQTCRPAPRPRKNAEAGPSTMR